MAGLDICSCYVQMRHDRPPCQLAHAEAAAAVGKLWSTPPSGKDPSTACRRMVAEAKRRRKEGTRFRRSDSDAAKRQALRAQNEREDRSRKAKTTLGLGSREPIRRGRTRLKETLLSKGLADFGRKFHGAYIKLQFSPATSCARVGVLCFPFKRMDWQWRST